MLLKWATGSANHFTDYSVVIPVAYISTTSVVAFSRITYAEKHVKLLQLEHTIL